MSVLLINHYISSIERGMEYQPFYLVHEWRRQRYQVTTILTLVAPMPTSVTATPIRIEKVDHIERTERGKFKDVISLVNRKNSLEEL